MAYRPKLPTDPRASGTTLALSHGSLSISGPVSPVSAVAPAWSWPHPPVPVPPGHTLISRANVDDPGCTLPCCVPMTPDHQRAHEAATRG
jgi:hypothetical protein